MVRAADSGVVTFAGSVAGRLSVTIHHGGGVRTSYSYLSTVLVSAGSSISSGDIVGTSGTHGGRPAVHYSLRIGNMYRAPPILRCVLIPADGLGLRGRGLGGLGLGPGPHRRRERRPLGRLRHAEVARGRIGPERRS